jgi:hypothetical protein
LCELAQAEIPQLQEVQELVRWLVDLCFLRMLEENKLKSLTILSYAPACDCQNGNREINLNFNKTATATQGTIEPKYTHDNRQTTGQHYRWHDKRSSVSPRCSTDDWISRIFEKSRGLANVTKISGEKEGVGQPCQKEMI